MRVVDLPREIIALFGDRLDVRARCACRLAHRIFAHINDNRTYHELTFRTPEHATSRAEASVKLKPRMDTIDITIDGLNDAIDLSPLGAVRHVFLTIIRCGDAYPTGVAGACVTITLSGDNVISDGLIDFLRVQKSVFVAIDAAHGRLLTDPAVACNVHYAVITASREGAEVDVSLLDACKHLEVLARCRKFDVKGFEKVTRLDVNHVTELDLAALRAWFTEDALTHGRLEDIQWKNTHWELTRGTDSAESHIVNTLRAASPKTRLRLDAWHPGVVRFVDLYVPADMNYEFWCCDTGHGADTYLSARMASELLATRNVPVFCERYTPPQELVELTGVSSLFARMEHDLLRDRWYIAKFI
jgi:hypothetical protein